jgi:mRNA-degrading endonuclease RelE of RelBE toxin-antitoxin system
MEIKYKIEYLEKVIKKHIPDLPLSARNIIKQAIEERLTTNPIGFGKPLQYSLKGHRRLRVGDYRVVFRIEKNIVVVVAIAHRKDIYE